MSVAQHVVRRPVLGIIVFGLISLIALYLVSDLAVDMFPDVDMPMLLVVASYEGASPETVEKSVTKPLEAQLVNLNGLSEMNSTSSEGSSMITLEFTYGTDLDSKSAIQARK